MDELKNQDLSQEDQDKLKKAMEDIAEIQTRNKGMGVFFVTAWPTIGDEHCSAAQLLGSDSTIVGALVNLANDSEDFNRIISKVSSHGSHSDNPLDKLMGDPMAFIDNLMKDRKPSFEDLLEHITKLSPEEADKQVKIIEEDGDECTNPSCSVHKPGGLLEALKKRSAEKE